MKRDTLKSTTASLILCFGMTTLLGSCDYSQEGPPSSLQMVLKPRSRAHSHDLKKSYLFDRRATALHQSLALWNARWRQNLEAQATRGEHLPVPPQPLEGVVNFLRDAQRGFFSKKEGVWRKDLGDPDFKFGKLSVILRGDLARRDSSQSDRTDAWVISVEGQGLLEDQAPQYLLKWNPKTSTLAIEGTAPVEKRFSCIFQFNGRNEVHGAQCENLVISRSDKRTLLAEDLVYDEKGVFHARGKFVPAKNPEEKWEL